MTPDNCPQTITLPVSLTLVMAVPCQLQTLATGTQASHGGECAHDRCEPGVVLSYQLELGRRRCESEDINHGLHGLGRSKALTANLRVPADVFDEWTADDLSKAVARAAELTLEEAVLDLSRKVSAENGD